MEVAIFSNFMMMHKFKGLSLEQDEINLLHACDK